MTQKKLYKTLMQSLKSSSLGSDLSPVYWLWRWGFVTRQNDRGFVLPTVTLLLIMLSLVVGTLVFRTFGRSTEVIGQRRQQALYNAATPAIERAKSKIEHLFTQSGLPVLATEEDIENSLASADYDLPVLGSVSAENRLDLDLDGTVDNAWLFETDTDGDGTPEAVAYSILSRASNLVDENATPTPNDPDDDELYRLSSDADLRKARAGVVRNGPLVQTRGANDNCPDATALSPIAGWERQATNTSKLRKALQVHSVVIDDNSGTSATLEFQQDRQVNFGNKWGAWFRSDLELHVGSAFNWNGAMHTEGSYFIGDGGSSDNGGIGNIRLYLISSPLSCVYEEDASEITMRQATDGTQGQLVKGRLFTDAFGTRSNFFVDVFGDPGLSGDDTTASVTVDTTKDSVINITTTPKVSVIALNPILLFTSNILEGRGSSTVDSTTGFAYNTNRPYRDSAWETGTGYKTSDRIFNPSIDVPAPYLDDTYRADDRWGPKLIYDERIGVETPQGSLGLDIANNPGTLPAGITTDYLLENDPLEDLADGDEAGFGLDGYWERRARRAGARFIVGQRLELGNTVEWYGDAATHAALDADASANATEIVVDDGNGSAALPLAVGTLIRIGTSTYTVSAVTADTPTADEDTYTLSSGLTTAVTDGTAITIESQVDPLYPPSGTYLSQPTALPMPSGREHELRQWRTLRDNLAAAQATAVYHYRADTDGDGTVEDGEGGEFPVACMATTSHPGTAATDRESRTFTYVDTDGSSGVVSLNTNFFTGQGTNGIEFSAPFDGDAATFEDQVNNANSPLRIALTNLAYFAGDPNGAFPATQNVVTGAMGNVDEVIHPYPLQTMWGNFSELRRVITLLESGDIYATLSPADQSTLHTASCTFGMLAYSLDINRKIFELRLEKELLKMLDDTSNVDILGTGVNGDGDGDYQDEVDAILAAPIDPSNLDLTSIPELIEKIEEINQALADEVSDNSGDWQSLVARFETALDGVAGAPSNADNLDWTGGSPNCPSYNANQSEINIDECLSLSDWLTANYPAVTWPGSVASFMATYGAEFYASFDYDAWISAAVPGVNTFDGLAGTLGELLDIDLSGVTLDPVELQLDTIDLYNLDRDRIRGFFRGSERISLGTSAITQTVDVLDGSVDLLDFGATLTVPLDFFQWDPDSGTIQRPSDVTSSFPNTLSSYKTGCNPALLSGLPNNLSTAQFQLAIIGVSHALCQQFLDASLDLNLRSELVVDTRDQVRYPSLYYLFPLAAHYHNGAFLIDSDGYTNVRTEAETAEITEANQSGTGNSYPTDPYIVDSSVNGSTVIKYRPVEDGLAGCSSVGCTNWQTNVATTRDGVVNADDGEDIADFVKYLGITPVVDIADTDDITDWQTPVETTANTDFEDDRHLIEIDNDGTIARLRPAFIDMGLFNSREQMSVRTLRLDLDQMRQKAIGNTACTWETPSNDTDDSNGLCWLPLPTLLESTGATTNTGAIIYAFREDAVREDAIVRPTTVDLSCAADYTTWQTRWNTIATASAASDLTAANLVPYFTDAIGNLLGQTTPAPQDPPVNPCTLVSPKPVDFYADPDRRPHGFMLTNGLDLRRRAAAGTWDEDGRGISFISDNPTYILGDFNAHTAATDTQAANISNRIEEFEEKLTSNTWGNFYARDEDPNGDNSPLDIRFTRADQDSWRVSAIVSDAVTVLSNSFVPGYADRGILWDTGDATYGVRNSYGGIHILRNSNSLTADTATEVHGGKTWWREDENAATGLQTSPIKFSRRGLPIYSSSGTSTEYGFVTTSPNQEYFEAANHRGHTNNIRNRVNNAEDTRIHSVIVSGISPGRNTQDTGGLNNFVRQIENWSGDTLSLFGSLVQLNFSVSTAPFDHDSWEPRSLYSGTNPPEGTFYYSPPTRDFGFDVGLLYVPPDPVASRFSTPSNVRSEFYQELAIDDPYIINLRCAHRDYNGDGQITTADSTAAGDRNEDGSINLQDAQVDPNATACSP